MPLYHYRYTSALTALTSWLFVWFTTRPHVSIEIRRLPASFDRFKEDLIKICFKLLMLLFIMWNRWPTWQHWSFNSGRRIPAVVMIIHYVCDALRSVGFFKSFFTLFCLNQNNVIFYCFVPSYQTIIVCLPYLVFRL